MKFRGCSSGPSLLRLSKSFFTNGLEMMTHCENCTWLTINRTEKRFESRNLLSLLFTVSKTRTVLFKHCSLIPMPHVCSFSHAPIGHRSFCGMCISSRTGLSSPPMRCHVLAFVTERERALGRTQLEAHTSKQRKTGVHPHSPVPGQ